MFQDFLTHFYYYLNSEIFLKFSLKYFWGLQYFFAFFFKFLLPPKVLSYARKSCSLKNPDSSLLSFIVNLFELAELFFVWIKRLGSYSSFDIWFLQKCVLSLSLAWLFRSSFFILHYYILLGMKFNSTKLWLNQISC